jgi:hypothetical protein
VDYGSRKYVIDGKSTPEESVWWYVILQSKVRNLG